MFGGHTRLPVEMVTETIGAQTASTTSKLVVRHAEEKKLRFVAEKNKRLYHKTARDALWLPGKQVYVKDHRRQGKGRLSDRWGNQAYVVVGRHHASLPVYKIRPEGEDGPECTLHRNRLHPCLLYPTSEPPQPAVKGPFSPPCLLGD